MNSGPLDDMPPQHPGTRPVVLAFTLLVLALVAWSGWYVLLLVFAGVLFAIFLRTLADWLAWFSPLSTGWALAVVVLLLLAITAASATAFGAQLVDQFGDLADQMPRSVESLRQRISEQPWGERLLRYAPRGDEFPVTGEEVASQATRVAASTLGALTALLIVLFLGIFLAASPKPYQMGVIKLVPTRRRERAWQVLDEVTQTLRWWLVGKIVSMTIVGALTTAGLWALGVPLALALGVLAALLAFIPNVGPVISVVPAALLAAVQSPLLAAWVLALYLVIQTVESYVVTPIVQQRAISLPPGLIIAAQVLLGLLMGGLGLVLATPLTATAVVLVRMLYVEDTLGDRVHHAGAQII